MKYLIFAMLFLSACSGPTAKRRGAPGECYQIGQYRFKITQTMEYGYKVSLDGRVLYITNKTLESGERADCPDEL